MGVGGRHTCTLSADGRACWGYNSVGQTSVPAIALSGMALPCLPSTLPIITPTAATSSSPAHSHRHLNADLFPSSLPPLSRT